MMIILTALLILTTLYLIKYYNESEKKESSNDVKVLFAKGSISEDDYIKKIGAIKGSGYDDSNI